MTAADRERRAYKEQEVYEDWETIRLRVCWEPVEAGERVLVTHPSYVYWCPDCGSGHLRGVVTSLAMRDDELGRPMEPLLKLAIEAPPDHAALHRRWVPASVVLKAVLA